MFTAATLQTNAVDRGAILVDADTLVPLALAPFADEADAKAFAAWAASILESRLDVVRAHRAAWERARLLPQCASDGCHERTETAAEVYCLPCTCAVVGSAVAHDTDPCPPPTIPPMPPRGTLRGVSMLDVMRAARHG